MLLRPVATLHCLTCFLLVLRFILLSLCRVMEDEEDPYGGSTECDTDDEDETNGKQKGALGAIA